MSGRVLLSFKNWFVVRMKKGSHGKRNSGPTQDDRISREITFPYPSHTPHLPFISSTGCILRDPVLPNVAAPHVHNTAQDIILFGRCLKMLMPHT
jgi:hypothetical protein